jgi:hypothetical protein
MKKICLFLTISLLTATLVSAQNEPLNDFIEQYKNDKAFTFAYLSEDLFEVVTQAEIEKKDWRKLQHVVKNIGSLCVLATKENPNGQALYKEALAHIPTGELDQLIAVRDGQDNVRIWSKDDGDSVTDLILLVGSEDEFVLACFTGNLELGNIAELARMFDSHEVEQLAQATEAVSIDFGISPNPSTGMFTLKYSDGQDLPAMLNIADQNGRIVITRRLSAVAEQQIQVQELPAGLYWVQVQTVQGKIGVKQLQIVKQP